MLDIVKREDEEVKDEISSFHTENPSAKCMYTFTGLVFKTDNNTKREMPSSDRNTQNYAVTSLPISKSNTYILSITQKQHQSHNKSDITDIPNHTAIVYTPMDTYSGKKPDREIPEHTAPSFDQISAKHADVDLLDQLFKINDDNSKDSYINLDELADIDIPDLDLHTVTPLSAADSFHQMASQ